MKNLETMTRGERMVPQVIILILYVITFIYFKRLPLSQVIHSYILAVTGTLFLVLALNLKFKVSMHSAALGGMAGLIIALIYLYQTPLQGVLILTLFAGGLAGSARMVQGESWGGILAGFLLGFGVLLFTILVY